MCSSYNGSLYAIWRVNYGASFVIRKYSIAGVYDATGDIVILKPTDNPTGFTAPNFRGFRGMAFYNDKIYFGGFWNNSGTHGTAILRYSITGTYEAIQFTLSGRVRTDDIDIDNNLLIASIRTQPANTYSTVVYNFTAGTLSQTIAAASNAIAFSPLRIYGSVGNTLQVYNQVIQELQQKMLVLAANIDVRQ